MHRLLLTLALLLASVGVCVPAAEAVALRGGDVVEIPAGTVIAEDLYVAGNVVRILGQVEGDVVVSGRVVTVSGKVRDDLIVFGATVTVDGEVGESIRVAGNTVTVAGGVGRDLFAAGNQIVQTDAAKIGGSAYLTGRDIRVGGATEGLLEAKGDTIRFAGRAGSASFKGQDLTVAEGAQLAGGLTYSAPRELVIPAGAQIAGPVTRERDGEGWTWRIPGWVGMSFLYMLGAVAGVLLALLAPRVLETIGGELRRNPFWVFVAGAGVLFGVPILAVLLVITILGIPLALSLLGFYAVGLYFAWVLAAIALGDLLLHRLPFRSLRMRMALAALLGIFVLLCLQGLPVLGGVVAVLALLAGFGAAAMTLVSRSLAVR